MDNKAIWDMLYDADRKTKTDPPERKTSRRLTDKERDVACAALVDYMLVVALPKEEQSLLTSAINKIRSLE